MTEPLSTRQRTHTKLTSKRRATFLRLLEAGSTVTAAAAVIGMRRESIYQARERDATFRDAWDHALETGTDLLEAECARRAMNGSDALLQFLLRARRPAIYRDRIDVRAGISGGMTLEQLVVSSGLTERLERARKRVREAEARDVEEASRLMTPRLGWSRESTPADHEPLTIDQ